MEVKFPAVRACPRRYQSYRLSDTGSLFMPRYGCESLRRIVPYLLAPPSAVTRGVGSDPSPQANGRGRWLLDARPSLDPQTGRAWALKELLRTLWRCSDRAQALAVFSRWYAWARRSRLEPIKDLAQRLRSRLGNILTYLEHRLTNAVSEGLNGALSTLLRRAYGYRNLHNLTTVLYFYLGGLSMDPALPAHANPG